MVSDINRKISDLVESGIDTEAHAVYFMVQIRKLLESGSKDNYPHLKFHCDWALHVRLSGSTTQQILKLFDHANDLLRNNGKLGNLPEPLKLAIEQISKNILFQKELDSFLKENMLPPISSVPDGWTKFLLLYAKVIEDCPLEINSTNATSSVEKITISVELVNKLVEAQQFYKITWNIVERNGEIGQIYVLNSFSVM